MADRPVRRAAPAGAVSREEFRRWAATQPGRYERLRGVIFAMAPERVVHNRVKHAVYNALRAAILKAGLPCEAFGDGLTVEIGNETDYEPDAVVHCGPRLADQEMTVAEPVIIVEVSSPGTQSIDAGAKLADYMTLPSVLHYLIVRADRRQVVHHRRERDRIETRIIASGAIDLSPPGMTVMLEDFYSQN